MGILSNSICFIYLFSITKIDGMLSIHPLNKDILYICFVLQCQPGMGMFYLIYIQVFCPILPNYFMLFLIYPDTAQK